MKSNATKNTEYYFNRIEHLRLQMRLLRKVKRLWKQLANALEQMSLTEGPGSPLYFRGQAHANAAREKLQELGEID